MHTSHNVKRTDDIRTVFKRTTDYIDPDRGKTEGHFCLVCRYVFLLTSDAVCNLLPREKGVREAAYFFSGGTSTLRTHIARYEPFIYSNVTSSLTLSKKRGPLRHLQRAMYEVEHTYQQSSRPGLKKCSVRYQFD